MRFTDIMRQGKKWVKGQFYVRSISAPEETRNGNFCQAIQAFDTVNIEECLNYFFTDDYFEMKPNEVGKQWLEVRWLADQNYYQCKPCDPPAPIWTDDEPPDWYKINLGKCRHGITISLIQSGRYDPYTLLKDTAQLIAIKKLSEFSMTGEFVDEQEQD